MEKTKQKWEEFRIRHRSLFRRIRREIPGFWAEGAKLGRSYHEETVMTRRVVVRDFPKTREIGTQTSDDRRVGRKRNRNVGEKPCQTPSRNVSLAALEAAADREIPGEWREGRSRERRASGQRMPFRGPEARRPGQLEAVRTGGRPTAGTAGGGTTDIRHVRSLAAVISVTGAERKT